MKLGDTWLKQLIRESVRKALESRINEPQILDIIRTHSIKELVYYDWDKIAFGFSSDDIIEIPMRSIRVQYNDMDNVTGFSMRKYFKGAAFEKLPPIEVSFKKGKFYIEEGHHRYGYALELGLKKETSIGGSFSNAAPLKYFRILN